MAITQREPFAATWLQREDRTPTVRLTANTSYWDKDRGPRLEEVVFRNDLSPSEALDLVCTTEGEVDIVTEVAPADAGKVDGSEHARLVSIDAVRTIAGVVNRDATGLPLGNARARRALNLAVNREKLVGEVMFGHAAPLAGLAPPSAVPEDAQLPPYPHDPGRAARLWREAWAEAGGDPGGSRPIRVACFGGLEGVARAVASDVREALGVETEVKVYSPEEEPRARRRLTEGALGQEWDVLVVGHGAQFVGSATAELHRAFVGATGEFRAGPVVPGFEDLFAELARKTDPEEQTEVAGRVDKLAYDEALALFLCAPYALYAVNRHVEFKPYRTTFELPECGVNEEHWSRRR